MAPGGDARVDATAHLQALLGIAKTTQAGGESRVDGSGADQTEHAQQQAQLQQLLALAQTTTTAAAAANTAAVFHAPGDPAAGRASGGPGGMPRTQVSPRPPPPPPVIPPHVLPTGPAGPLGPLATSSELPPRRFSAADPSFPLVVAGCLGVALPSLSRPRQCLRRTHPLQERRTTSSGVAAPIQVTGLATCCLPAAAAAPYARVRVPSLRATAHRYLLSPRLRHTGDTLLP